MTSSLLDQLNPQQQEAVKYVEGALLILAGAGSGKTRVLTYKIAYLLEAGLVKPHEILAVTFTNKAANEMKQRIEQLIESQVQGMWIGTFHSICARILRVEANHLGYSRNFTIYDVEDQIKQIQRIMEFLNIDQKTLKPRSVQYVISQNKNKLKGAEEFEKSARDYTSRQIANVFWEYEAALSRNNALDFDDLLLKPLELFTQNEEIRTKYAERFKYILVDEYQDTNRAQYHFIKLLSSNYKRICVVGDEDQSIYRWRGADIENILSFEKDFPDCKTIRLEQNYRSTQTILNAANSLVANNLQRLGKNLWSKKDVGEKINLISAPTEAAEARHVLKIINDLRSRAEYSLNDFAILYRTNAQSRAIEDQLRRAGIPYKLVGGTKFYERREIKDILAYLKVLVNPADSNILRRIINIPTRGIGAISLRHVENFANEKKISLYQAISDAEEISQLSTAAKGSLKIFVDQLEDLRVKLSEVTAYEIASEVTEMFNLRSRFNNSELPEDEARFENVNELLNSLAIFTQNNAESDASLEVYLQEVSLLTDIDYWDPENNAVTLITLHSAKGLEFPVIMITGLEDGLFPIARSLERDDDLEEERRLFYVGMTRAKDYLYLLWAKRRYGFQTSEYGMAHRNIPSRFLKEIPSEYISKPFAETEFSDRQAHIDFGYGNDRTAGAPLMEESGYTIGDWIVHDDFGKGQILGVGKSGNGTKLTIIFSKNQIKKIIAEYANIQVIE